MGGGLEAWRISYRQLIDAVAQACPFLTRSIWILGFGVHDHLLFTDSGLLATCACRPALPLLSASLCLAAAAK